MLQFIKNLFGFTKTPDYRELIQDGAIILDVRAKGEFDGGHIGGAKNISVQALKDALEELPDKDRAIITCCASGMRSAVATGILKSAGYSKVFNGGSWNGLQNKIRP